MKAKLLFFALLLSVAAPCLKAWPGGDGEPEVSVEEQRIRDEQAQATAQRERDAVASGNTSSALDERGVMNSGGAVDETAASAAVDSSASTGTKTLTPEQSLERAHRWLELALQKNDPNTKEWGYARARINKLKQWCEDAIRPPALPLVDRWLGRKPKVPVQTEVEQAHLLKVKVHAFEAALPLWKETAVVGKAIENFSSQSSSAKPTEESTNCWSFWKKTPDLSAQASNEVTESQTSLSDLVAKLKNFSSKLLENKEAAPPQFQEWYENYSKRLAYIASVYQAKLDDSEFLNALDQPGDHNNVGSTAIASWEKAIEMKKRTLSEGIVTKIETAACSSSKASTESWSPEELAAKEKIEEFQNRIQEISDALTQIPNDSGSSFLADEEELDEA